jgi:hypothetical protein
VKNWLAVVEAGAAHAAGRHPAADALALVQDGDAPAGIA